MAKIEYIGKKPAKTDNVAGTETVWNGQGDVQEVSDPVAVEKLLAHKNVWRLVGESPVAAKPAAKAKTAAKAEKKEDDEDSLPPLANFQRMGKDAIEKYARAHLSYEVDQRASLVKIRAKAQQEYNRIVGTK